MCFDEPGEARTKEEGLRASLSAFGEFALLPLPRLQEYWSEAYTDAS
jgi:hypothetical protein